MGTRWAPAADRLVDHWGPKVAKAIAADLRAEGSKLVVNLASNEYFAVLKGQLPKRVRVIAPDFRVHTAKGLQFQSFTAKVARGAMARWLCDERVADPAALADFDRDGWARPDGSTPPSRCSSSAGRAGAPLFASRLTAAWARDAYTRGARSPGRADRNRNGRIDANEWQWWM